MPLLLMRISFNLRPNRFRLWLTSVGARASRQMSRDEDAQSIVCAVPSSQISWGAAVLGARHNNDWSMGMAQRCPRDAAEHDLACCRNVHATQPSSLPHSARWHTR
jgi:hypothetical protein